MAAPVYANETDRSLLSIIQQRTLEQDNAGASMTTAQFGIDPATALTAVIDALNQAQRDFLKDTGVVAVHLGSSGDQLSGEIGVPANTEKVALPQDLMDVRRRAWITYRTP